MNTTDADFLSTDARFNSYGELIEIINLFCDTTGGEQRFVEFYSRLDDHGKTSVTRLGKLLGKHHRSAHRLTEALSEYQAVPSKGGIGRREKYAPARTLVDEFVDRWKRGDLPKIRRANQLAALACEDMRINVAQRTVENWISHAVRNRWSSLKT